MGSEILINLPSDNGPLSICAITGNRLHSSERERKKRRIGSRLDENRIAFPHSLSSTAAAIIGSSQGDDGEMTRLQEAAFPSPSLPLRTLRKVEVEEATYGFCKRAASWEAMNIIWPTHGKERLYSSQILLNFKR